MTIEATAAHDDGSSITVRSDYDRFEGLYPALRRFAAVVADVDMDPDDLVQDALAATLARQPLSELDEPKAYLKRAIVNRASNARRKAGRFRTLLPRIQREDQLRDHYPSDLAVLDALDPLDRAVVFLIDVEGLQSDEVAEQLGLSGAATRKRASRGRARLRALIEDERSES